MRVILDCSALARPLSGMGRYVAELLAALPDEIEVVRFAGRAPPPAAGRWRRWARLGRHLPGARALAQRIGQNAFATQVRRCRPALYHEPGYFAHRFAGPLVVTAHDASWVRYPEMHPRERVRAMNAAFPAVLERAGRVIVDSGFVAGELRELFGVPDEKLRVVHLGVSARFRPRAPEETAPVRAPLDIAHGAYLLAVGTLEPRKNLITLLHAYGRLSAALRARFPLVVVGMPGWKHGEADALLERMRRRGEARLVGHVGDDALAALYAGAALFAYPSLYEGFGLPPLEAMASGVPVVVSDRASLPEVVGAAGRQVVALDVEALTQELAALLEDAGARAALSAAGLQRAAGFTWRACARRTADVYRELAA